MRYFKTNYCFSNLAARESFLNSQRHMFCKYMHSSQFFIAQIVDIIDFFLGTTSVCPFTNGFISKKHRTYRPLQPYNWEFPPQRFY